MEHYEIIIKGHLDSYRLEYFAGIQVILLAGGETRLVGPVADQAALHSLLTLIRDLGLPLLRVNRLDNQDIQNSWRSIVNKTKNNFWLDVLLFFIFVIVIISSFVVDNKDPNLLLWGFNRPGWVLIHVTTALAMLAGSSLHLLWHWDWIKAVLKHTSRPKPKQVRRNRLVDIAMFALLFLISLSGLLIWPLTGNLDEGNPLGDAPLLGVTYYDWKQLHAWGAVLIMVLMLLHLALHWRWVVSTSRRLVTPGARPKNEKISEFERKAMIGD